MPVSRKARRGARRRNPPDFPRPEQGRVLYGINPLLEAARAGRRVEALWYIPSKRKAAERIASAVAAVSGDGPRLSETDGNTIRELAGTPKHQGVAGLVEFIPTLDAGSLREELRRLAARNAVVLLLDGVEDPGNLGNIYRSADACGVDLVILPSRGSASIQLASVAKASAGAVEHVRSAVVDKLAKIAPALEESGFEILAFEGRPKGRTDFRLHSYKPPLALVMGSEGRGVSGPLLRACGEILYIPMRGRLNSLNVASSTAVVLHHVVFQHLLPPGAGDVDRQRD